ncbi:MAG: FG-GAP-like repeat-containing protein [bacterium]
MNIHKKFLGVICALLGTAIGSSAALTDGLVHHWNMDDGQDWHDSAFRVGSTNAIALDSVGQAYAVLKNMDKTNWVSGRQFTALCFDGVNDYLETAENLGETLGKTATLSFWLRTTQIGGTSASSAPGVTGVVGNGGIQWGWIDEKGCIALSVNNALLVRSRQPINDGQWHHVLFMHDCMTGEGKIFVDGKLDGRAVGVKGISKSNFRSLGRIENPVRPSYFAGRLDQIHIFNRVLSDPEVATLLTNHAPKCWDMTTEGVSGRTFSTASIYARTYDVERDPVAVVRWDQPLHGKVSYNGDGSFNYTAKSGFIGNDSFAVTVGDGRGGFHQATLHVKVLRESASGGIPMTQFKEFEALKAGSSEIIHKGWRVPRVIDWNNDGKLDLLVGAGGNVWCYINTGTLNRPTFSAGEKVVDSAGTVISSGSQISPVALADMTGDSVQDLVIADSANKLRIYRNTASAKKMPVYDHATFYVKNSDGGDFILPDSRFDVGDWNGDGLPDLVTGAGSGSVQLFLNKGTSTEPRFGTGTVLYSNSYNLFPRLFDLNGNGPMDLICGINWGNISYWRDVCDMGLSAPMTLAISDMNHANPNMHQLTDGAIVDFGDFNGDGKLDIVIGGHGNDKLYLAWGEQKTVAASLAEIEKIYDANLSRVGSVLSANNNTLLNAVNHANQNLISHIMFGTLGVRETLYSALTRHVRKYDFLKYQTLSTNQFNHVPSIALQNWVMLGYSLPDVPARRAEIADTMKLTGMMRTIYLENGLAVGDNAKSIPAAYGTLRDFMLRHPRELFPDAVLTIDQLYGQGRGGFIWTPNSTKNTFGDWAVHNANEWAHDLTSAIENELGKGAASGDYFTFVMGHEICHSLDGYVRSRANKDLQKRWGLVLCTAAGSDVVPGDNGWYDVKRTQERFQKQGHWDGKADSWSAAWTAYWKSGPGAAFKNLSFMRFDISWFLGAPQESLATQANHHWANAPGRLIGAVDRFKRGDEPGLAPLKANINEVVTFIDFLSAGMNRINLVETKSEPSPKHVRWIDHYADLQRDDRGYIDRITVDGRDYSFGLREDGVVTNVLVRMVSVKP